MQCRGIILVFRCGQVCFGRPGVAICKVSRCSRLFHSNSLSGRHAAAGSARAVATTVPSLQSAPKSTGNVSHDDEAEMATRSPGFPSRYRDENGALPLDGARQLLASVDSRDDLESMQDFIEMVLRLDQEYPRIRVAAFVLQVLTLFWRSLDKALDKKTPEAQQRSKDTATARLMMRIDKGLRKKFQSVGPELADRMVMLLARCHAEPVLLMDNLLNLAQQPTNLGESGGIGGSEDPARRLSCEILHAGQATASQPPARTEARSKSGRILDVDVRCELDAQVAGVHVPSSDRTVIVSNLPTGTTDEVLRDALVSCGQVHRVEVIEVFSPVLRVFAPRVVEVPGSAGTTDPTRTSEGCYAIVEFATAAGYKHATRRAVRMFGVLLQVKTPKGKKKKLSPTGWPAFPQDARYKRSLVLTNLPWSSRPRDILAECAQRLKSFAANGECVLEATNCRSFRASKSTHIESLVVHASAGEAQPVIREQPIITGPRPKQYWSDGTVVLRFDSFEQASIARLVLGSLHFGDRKMFCNFAPQRPTFCDEDSAGNALEQPRFVDFPLQRRRQDPDHSRESDPIVRFGIPADEFDDFDTTVAGVLGLREQAGRHASTP